MAKSATKEKPAAKPAPKTVTDKPVAGTPGRKPKPTLEELISRLAAAGVAFNASELATELAGYLAKPRGERTTKVRVVFLGIRTGKYKSTAVKIEVASADDLVAKLEGERVAEEANGLTLDWVGHVWQVDRNRVIDYANFQFPAPTTEPVEPEAE